MYLSPSVTFSITALLLMSAITMPAETKPPLEFQTSAKLQPIVDSVAQQTLAKYADKKLETNQLAITLVELSKSDKPEWASFRGDVQIYPASVIKMFYLAAAHRWMEDGKLKDTEELRRAMKDMIVD